MIDVQRTGGLWTLTLNRPDKANSLTRPMLETLAGLAEEAQGAAKVLVLTGTGTVFSAGADLTEARAGLATDPVWERLSDALAALPCLTIAALNGTLAGGAVGMALACDLRVAVPATTVFYPVMRLGFLPQPSDPARLVRLVGPARAKLILMAGARVTAAEALAMGLIDQIAPADGLTETVARLAAPALAADPALIAAIKAMTATELRR
ncbi:enoyl-CoA hydratase/isomerase family protein [Pseudoruegeria sp. SK021]|uniref:enoyl-CoA hydratase/isomerase family protein n=1 Tax=Pseudoruegeria sp. SK021 TaxID=1933035 RepID=UPI000A253E0B|nr:enoyl-CoA hydratase/isomerase family protein [Pseudoruegeria sp. SK021]OSP55065.1 enoyl-CoA hydratase [Pseudoruegeria sp. SK021]